MKKISILCLALFCFFFSQSQIRYFHGTFRASDEVPAPTGGANGGGVVIAQYDTATKILKLFGDYDSLTNSITASHIHRGEPGVAGPVIIDLTNTGGTNGTLSVTTTLTKAWEDSLYAGNLYANVHTATNPQGELRAQLIPTASGQAAYLTGRLQGAQETPPDSSQATGPVYALVDMVTDTAYITGKYTGLSSASTGAHLHLGNPGTSGETTITLTLTQSAATFGTLHGSGKVAPGDVTAIASGLSYVNIHTTKYVTGEVRAQLLNTVTGRYFAANLSGANEAQPNTSKARGTIIVSYNPDLKLLNLGGDYQHLSDTITAANLVTPGAGVDSNVALISSRDSTGTLQALEKTLTAAQEADLLAGNAYVNVFTKPFPLGEISTKLTEMPMATTQAYTIQLSPKQEVPANTTSAATGNAAVLLDKATGMTYVSGAFTGINSTVTKAYIRGGNVGDTSGTVFLNLIPAYITGKASGTFSGSGIVPPAAIDSMVNGLSYINVFSTRLTTGAIRGQLGNLVLPVKLQYFNGYKQRNQVELVWETAEELNVNRYEVQQLNPATQQWTTKGSVPAKGGSSANTYNFTDLPTSYSNAYVFYRLKMIDNDGKTTYSSLVRINFDKLKAELFIQTNPVVNGELKYTITGLSADKKAEVSIIDYNGRLMLRNTVSSLMNNTIRVQNLSSGMYKLIVRVDDTVLQKTFVK